MIISTSFLNDLDLTDKKGSVRRDFQQNYLSRNHNFLDRTRHHDSSSREKILLDSDISSAEAPGLNRKLRALIEERVQL